MSLFSGVGGLDLGLHQAGLRIRVQCESDDWRADILTHHWPGVTCYRDVRGVDGRHWDFPVDLICGGFPCQDVSVAGRRAGLAGDRSGLFFEAVRIIQTVRPRWVLIENVPGLFTSNGGRDFGVVLGELADVGYGVAWRVLNSRYFGVPQRRRRVFIVGALADGDPRTASERAAQVLAVGSGCEGHPPSGRETRSDHPLPSLSGLGDGGPDDNDAQGGRLVTTHTLTSAGHDASEDGTGRGTPLTVGTLTRGSATGMDREMVDADQIIASHATGGGAKGLACGHLSPGAGLGGNGAPAIAGGVGVRRLTPRECERLQGFPDDWTLVPTVRCPDSRRYAAMGDAVTVPVARWLGERIQQAEMETGQ